ncbi:MAG: hypothetical protein HGB17_11290 [Syntrophobacteraceae bacterium]|nr:hypothetical protein [Syntrophobacteraceae bacterium]
MTAEWQEMARFGRKIVSAGLTSSRFGNISILRGKSIFITATGSSLDELDGDLVVEMELDGPCPRTASSETCVQYLAGQCQGTAFRRIVTGPLYGKLDMSFVKRFTLPKNMKIEARMDLFNVLDTINFNSTNSMGSSFVNWQVTSAATDPNASQDPGGRITSFGLRFTW